MNSDQSEKLLASSTYGKLAAQQIVELASLEAIRHWIVDVSMMMTFLLDTGFDHQGTGPVDVLIRARMRELLKIVKLD